MKIGAPRRLKRTQHTDHSNKLVNSQKPTIRQVCNFSKLGLKPWKKYIFFKNKFIKKKHFF